MCLADLRYSATIVVLEVMLMWTSRDEFGLPEQVKTGSRPMRRVSANPAPRCQRVMGLLS